MENFCKKISLPLSRFAIFIIYFWFGALKVFSESPANPLVDSLLHKTLPFMPFPTFILLLGIFEMMIGLIFLVPKLERVAVSLLLIHIVMTLMPLILLPIMTWQRFLVPTMEGQYIIKNILIVALAVVILAHSHHNKDNV